MEKHTQKIYIEPDVWEQLQPLITWPGGRTIYGAVTRVVNIALRRHLADLRREALRLDAADPCALTDQPPPQPAELDTRNGPAYNTAHNPEISPYESEND